MLRLAASIFCTLLLPLVSANDTSYKISNVQANEIPQSDQSIWEHMVLNVQGTDPGAPAVACGLGWNVSAAAQVPATGPPLVEQFYCDDNTVNVTMQRMTVSPRKPWYLTVIVNGADPVTWNPYAHGLIPYRIGNMTNQATGQSYSSWLFTSEGYNPPPVFTISGVPSMSLPEALKQWNDGQNRTAIQSTNSTVIQTFAAVQTPATIQTLATIRSPAAISTPA